MTPRNTLALLILLVFSSGCKSTRHKELESIAKLVGTDGKTKWINRRVVEDVESMGLHFPGYLIGIEKGSHRKIAKNEGEGEAFRLGILDRVKAEKTELGILSTMHNAVEKGLDVHVKRHFVSHIVKYQNEGPFGRIQKEFLYDIYQNLSEKTLSPSDAFESSFSAIADLGNSLETEVNNGATHIFVYCMGWNTDQQEAIRNYNSLFGNFLAQCEKDSTMRSIRPVFVGITWDSNWDIPLFPSKIVKVVSYPNKANDADEVGNTWANLLINREILGLKKTYPNLKVVLVGHSFGTRVLSAATFGRTLLPQKWRPDGGYNDPDLVLLFQSAFSLQRFVREGNSGSPVYDVAKFPNSKFVLTWSEHDSANTMAKWTAHAGGSKGYNYAKRHEPSYFDFPVAEVDSNDRFIHPPQTGKPVEYYDASPIISDSAYRKGGDAHSDIYSPRIGNFTMEMIKRHTQ